MNSNNFEFGDFRSGTAPLMNRSSPKNLVINKNGSSQPSNAAGGSRTKNVTSRPKTKGSLADSDLSELNAALRLNRLEKDVDDEHSDPFPSSNNVRRAQEEIGFSKAVQNLTSSTTDGWASGVDRDRAKAAGGDSDNRVSQNAWEKSGDTATKRRGSLQGAGTGGMLPAKADTAGNQSRYTRLKPATPVFSANRAVGSANASTTATAAAAALPQPVRRSSKAASTPGASTAASNKDSQFLQPSSSSNRRESNPMASPMVSPVPKSGRISAGASHRSAATGIGVSSGAAGVGSAKLATAGTMIDPTGGSILRTSSARLRAQVSQAQVQILIQQQQQQQQAADAGGVGGPAASSSSSTARNRLASANSALTREETAAKNRASANTMRSSQSAQQPTRTAAVQGPAASSGTMTYQLGSMDDAKEVEDEILESWDFDSPLPSERRSTRNKGASSAIGSAAAPSTSSQAPALPARVSPSSFLEEFSSAGIEVVGDIQLDESFSFSSKRDRPESRKLYMNADPGNTKFGGNVGIPHPGTTKFGADIGISSGKPVPVPLIPSLGERPPTSIQQGRNSPSRGGPVHSAGAGARIRLNTSGLEGDGLLSPIGPADTGVSETPRQQLKKVASFKGPVRLSPSSTIPWPDRDVSTQRPPSRQRSAFPVHLADVSHDLGQIDEPTSQHAESSSHSSPHSPDTVEVDPYEASADAQSWGAEGKGTMKKSSVRPPSRQKPAAQNLFEGTLQPSKSEDVAGSTGGGGGGGGIVPISNTRGQWSSTATIAGAGAENVARPYNASAAPATAPVVIAQGGGGSSSNTTGSNSLGRGPTARTLQTRSGVSSRARMNDPVADGFADLGFPGDAPMPFKIEVTYGPSAGPSSRTFVDHFEDRFGGARASPTMSEQSGDMEMEYDYSAESRPMTSLMGTMAGSPANGPMFLKNNSPSMYPELSTRSRTSSPIVAIFKPVDHSPDAVSAPLTAPAKFRAPPLLRSSSHGSYHGTSSDKPSEKGDSSGGVGTSAGGTAGVGTSTLMETDRGAADRQSWMSGTTPRYSGGNGATAAGSGSGSGGGGGGGKSSSANGWTALGSQGLPHREDYGPAPVSHRRHSNSGTGNPSISGPHAMRPNTVAVSPADIQNDGTFDYLDEDDTIMTEDSGGELGISADLQSFNLETSLGEDFLSLFAPGFAPPPR